MAGNKAVRSTDADADAETGLDWTGLDWTGLDWTGLAKIFDADKVQREVNAQVQITQYFGQQAANAVATFAAGQMAELKTHANAVTDPAKKQARLDDVAKWTEGGKDVKSVDIGTLGFFLRIHRKWPAHPAHRCSFHGASFPKVQKMLETLVVCTALFLLYCLFRR